MEPRTTALDGLRGVAALAVVFYHVGLIRSQSFFSQGYIAVDLFFLLSGLVVGAAYEKRFASGLGPAAYMWIRIRRLYPIMAIGVLLGLASVSFRTDPLNPLRDAAAQLAFIPVFGRSTFAFPLNWVEWSLWFEFFINGAHALAWRWLSTPVLALVTAGSAIALIVVDRRYGGLLVGYGPTVFGAGFVRVAASFALGLLIFRVRDGLPRLRVPYPVTLAVCGLVLFAPKLVPDAAVVLLLWPVVVVAALNAKPRGWIGRVARVAGAVSYPLYAIHLPLLLIGADLLGGIGSHAVKLAGWGVVMTVILGVAWVLARWMEPGYPRAGKGPAGGAPGRVATSVGSGET